jgi:membrane protein implicated in regulation of membrane protease activity
MIPLDNLLIGGVPIAALVVGLVSLAKQAGLPGKYAPWLNGALAALGFLIASWLLPTYPALVPYFEMATGAIVVFLTASGIYQFGKVKSGQS